MDELLREPQLILKKEPFLRGCRDIDLIVEIDSQIMGTEANVVLTNKNFKVVTQDQFIQELDPMCHAVHFDETIPDIAVQKVTKKGNVTGYLRQKGVRAAFNYQEQISNKRTQYLCGNPTTLTLCNNKPNESIKDLFNVAKEEWLNKNMDIWRYKLVRSQMRTGDGAILHYFKKTNKGIQLKQRLLSYEDGYVLLPHYDNNGELSLFGVYYNDNDVTRLDVYTDTSVYKYTNNVEVGWTQVEVVNHGFSRIPITYKRGAPAWDKVQNIIEIYEILYNVYTVVQKRFGNSILWVKGNYDAKTRKQGWAVVLNSSSLDEHADAKVLSPAEPVGMQNLLDDIRKHIQSGSSTVILQPEDIKIGGDLSGLAVKMMLSSAYENASREAMEYDEVADSMVGIFLEGLGIEMENSVEMSKLKIRANFEPWMPQSDTDIVNNLNLSVQAGTLSARTASSKHPFAAADEYTRIKDEMQEEQAALLVQKTTNQTQAAGGSNNGD